MQVTAIYIPTDTELYKAIIRNREKVAKEYNIKEAEKYLKYCKSTGDEILINYATKLLINAKN